MRSILKYPAPDFLWYNKFHYHIATFLQGSFHFHIFSKFSLTKMKMRIDRKLMFSSIFEQLTFTKWRICQVDCLLEDQGCQLVSRHSPQCLFSGLPLWYTSLNFFFLARQLVAMPFYPYLTLLPLHSAELRSKHILLISVFSLLRSNVSFEQAIKYPSKDMYHPIPSGSEKVMSLCLCLFVDIYILFIIYTLL